MTWLLPAYFLGSIWVTIVSLWHFQARRSPGRGTWPNRRRRSFRKTACRLLAAAHGDTGQDILDGSRAGDTCVYTSVSTTKEAAAKTWRKVTDTTNRMRAGKALRRARGARLLITQAHMAVARVAH